MSKRAREQATRPSGWLGALALALLGKLRVNIGEPDEHEAL